MTPDRMHAEAGPQPTVATTEHETVIKFVLSGPILTGHASHVAEPPADVTELVERVAALERALADADARIDALSRAVASTVAHAPFVEPISESVELLLRRVAAQDLPAVGGTASWTTPAAARSVTAPRATPPELAPPDGMSQLPNGSHPPPQSEPAPPKVRGLRRMATALKHH